MALSAVRTPLSLPVQDPWTEKIHSTPWLASTAYVVGDIVRSSAESGHFYQCIIAGTSDSSAPSWTTNYANVTDNSVTWQDLGVGYPGTPIVRPNGQVGVIIGIEPISQNNTMVTLTFVGCHSFVSASGTTFAAGDRVYWNPLTGYAVTAWSGAGLAGMYLGKARRAKASTDLAVAVDVNIGGSPDLLYNAGAPSSGSTGTAYNYANPGALLIDTTNKLLYQNIGTKAAPVWAAAGLETT